jgi:MYXO-CTERM domain-containing protein
MRLRLLLVVAMAAWLVPRAAEAREPEARTVYLVFDGCVIEEGTNAAYLEASCLPYNVAPVDYPAYVGDEEARATIVDRFREALDPFDVRVVTERPPLHLPHDVVVFGGRPIDIGHHQAMQGIACHVDCGDDWPLDLAFVFTEFIEDDPVLVANIGLHELAHTWGLDHIEGVDHIMYRIPDTGMIEWAAECTGRGTNQFMCEWAHAEACGENTGQQNSFAEIMVLFGPYSDDTIAPEITILEPADGLQREIGLMDIEVEVQDDRGGAGWKMEIPELEWELIAFEKERTAELPMPDPGTYTVRVEAIDHDRNVTVEEASVEIFPAGSLDEHSPKEPDGSAWDPDGCACAASPHARPVGLLALLALVARRRRQPDS